MWMERALQTAVKEAKQSVEDDREGWDSKRLERQTNNCAVPAAAEVATATTISELIAF